MARAHIPIAVAVWSICVFLGLLVMLNFELTPAAIPALPPIWPLSSQIHRDADLPTLLLFLHPRCPCSRATLSELEKLLATCPDQCSVRAIFVRPPGTIADWELTGLYRAAASIPGMSVCSDENGAEAARFGATTSGLALLYAPDGQLLFKGGLTASRGHEGDNPGRSALHQLLTGNEPYCRASTVFGCPLSNPHQP
jgi:hypothetical protein